MRYYVSGGQALKHVTRSLSKVFIICCVLTLVFIPKKGMTAGLIRDAETETLIRTYANPIFEAANLGSQNIRIHIIGSRTFNAFVVDGQNMFFHVGALMQTKTPNELIGIIAHETGHIAGGHLAGLRRQIARNQGTALVCQVLGILATTAAVASGGGGNIGSAGVAAVSGCGSLVQRSILAYRRAHESAADQAALTYLNATGQSGRGMIETFEYLADQSLASVRFIDPYIQSHPIPRQRIAQLRYMAERSQHYDKVDPPNLQLRHDMMRAKIFGYMNRPQAVFNKYRPDDTSYPAQYARAIAHYRSGNLQEAINGLDRLIKVMPGNPYLYEIKGQFLYEKGRANEAVPLIRKALEMVPNEHLIRILLSQALLATNNADNADEVIAQLKKALIYEKTSVRGYRLLAQAYGRKGMEAEARLASAHRYLYEGKLKDAKTQATWAIKNFKRGSSYWIQADDIINFRPNAR